MTFSDELRHTLESGEFSRDDISDVAAALMLLEAHLPDGAHEVELLGRLVERAQLSGTQTAEQVIAQLSRYFEGRATELLFTRIAQLAREDLAAGSRKGQDYATLIGGKAIPSVLVRGERPAGTVAAGPAARFAVLELLKQS